jgi:hypothetical protein
MVVRNTQPDAICRTPEQPASKEEIQEARSVLGRLAYEIGRLEAKLAFRKWREEQRDEETK